MSALGMRVEVEPPPVKFTARNPTTESGHHALAVFVELAKHPHGTYVTIEHPGDLMLDLFRKSLGTRVRKSVPGKTATVYVTATGRVACAIVPVLKVAS